jgi:serine/threonine protein phosphatase PrpC
MRFSQKKWRIICLFEYPVGRPGNWHLVITRNNPAPVFIAQRERVECLGSESSAIGLSRHIRPVISEIPLEYGTTIVMYTDGLLNAGMRNGQGFDICTLLESLLEDQEPTAQEIADSILLNAIRMDNDRPDDDMSIVVLRALPKERDLIRRMTVFIPVRMNEPDYQS